MSNQSLELTMYENPALGWLLRLERNFELTCYMKYAFLFTANA